MSLPKLNQPIFSMTLPSSGKKIRFRPFTVKEEKLLLIAQSSGDRADIANVYAQLVNNCSLDKLDVETMSAIDLEYFFLQLRCKSVSNITKVIITDDDGEEHEVEVDLEKVEVRQDKVVDKKLQLDDKVGVILRHPSINSILKLDAMKDDPVAAALMMYRECIEAIYTDDTIHQTSECSPEELEEFILSMSAAQMEKVVEFINCAPYLVYEGTYIDPKEPEKERKFTITGLESFFE